MKYVLIVAIVVAGAFWLFGQEQSTQEVSIVTDESNSTESLVDTVTEPIAPVEQQVVPAEKLVALSEPENEEIIENDSKPEEIVEVVPENSPEPVVEAAPGTYQPYSPDKLALAAEGNVVLFFHASWCPSCKALEKDILANADSIPSDLHILKIDYDNSDELKDQYKVNRQHTLIVVDQNGVEQQRLPFFYLTLDQISTALNT